MATSTKPKKTSKKDIPITDRSIFWSDLQALPSIDKNELFCAELLFFMKRNAKLFLDPVRAANYRSTDRLELNEKLYKEMVDPTTPMSAGGQASYFSADWKSNPLYLHLKNIVKAKLEKSGKQLEVNLTDKYAKTERMNSNYTILYRDLFRTIINENAPLVGLPTISDKEDPFKWVKKTFQEKEDSGQPTNDVVDSYVELIRNQITDSQDLAVYNELIYKGDYERAFELAIDYYIFNLNKWRDRYEDAFIDDYMHFNKVCGEWYTDLMTGRPVIERFVGERLFVSPFKQKDGEDILYYFIEYDITFGDFAKTIGKKLTAEKLKEVFLFQKAQGSHNVNWVDNIYVANRNRDNAMIRIGRAAALCQDIYVSDSVDMDDVVANSPYGSISPLTWQKLDDGKQAIEKYYNVWYSWYYLPPTLSSMSNADFTWQAKFIFDIKKNQDQFRYGEDGRFSKSPLVIYDNSSQASFTDITQYYMPKISHAAHKFQNCLVNDLDAIVLADDFIGGLLGAIDESNKINPANPNEATGGNGRDAMMEQWKMIQQGGKGFLQMTDRKTGQLMVDPSKLVIPIKNGYLDKAEKYLTIIAMMYDEMSRAVAQSAISTGENIKPRTPVSALKESLKASEDSTFAIQKGYEAFLKQYGERIIQYIIMIAKESKEGYSKRWDEFLENVGYANGLSIEGMADIPPEAVGLTVEYLDNEGKKDFLMQLCTEYVKTGQIGFEFLDLLLSIDNYKYGMMLIRIGLKKKQKEAQEEAAVQQQYIMQQKQMDLQIAMQMNQAKTQGKQAEISTQGQITDMINKALNQYKFQSQSALKSLTTENKIQENIAKLDAETKKELQSPLQE